MSGISRFSRTQPRGQNNQRVSVCKNCRLGLFAGQPALWQKGPLPGLIHAECAGPEGTFVAVCDTRLVSIRQPTADNPI